MHHDSMASLIVCTCTNQCKALFQRGHLDAVVREVLQRIRQVTEVILVGCSSCHSIFEAVHAVFRIEEHPASHIKLSPADEEWVCQVSVMQGEGDKRCKRRERGDRETKKRDGKVVRNSLRMCLCALFSTFEAGQGNMIALLSRMIGFLKTM